MIKKNYFLWGLLLTVTLSGMLLIYQLVYSPVLPGPMQSKTLRIPSGTDFKGMLILLKKEKILANTTVFSILSEKMNFKEGKVKPGQYKINKGINLIQLVRKFRAGNQEPVNVVLATERMPENVAAKVSSFIEPDSISLNDIFSANEIIGTDGFTRENFQSLFIPNTYQMYWNTTTQVFLSRMKTEYDKFWASNQRLKKAESLLLTPQ